MQARYRLPDEPRPSGLGRFAVDPMWPLLAMMLAGTGAGLAWFAFNSVALGSPTRAREWACIVGALAGSALLLVMLGVAGAQGWLDAAQMRYAALSVIALKLSLGYVLLLQQQRSHELHAYYGRETANGLPVLAVLGLFVRPLLAGSGLPPLLAGVLQ